MQEINAKRKLDKIALLTRAKVRVLRDGQEQTTALSTFVAFAYPSAFFAAAAGPETASDSPHY